MAFRRKSRSWWWPRLVLLMPRCYRLKRAAAYRAYSQSAKQQKSAAIMDVTPAEVVRIMDEQKVTRLIHGHTHRPACHRVNLPQGTGWRWVLGEWHHSLSYLKVTATSCELLFTPIAPEPGANRPA